MRFLANENFPLDAVEALGQNGNDVLWIRVKSPEIPNLEVLSRAKAKNRILLPLIKILENSLFAQGCQPA